MTRFLLGFTAAVVFIGALTLPWWASNDSVAIDTMSPSVNVPQVEIKTEVPDFTEIQDTRQRKQSFFEFLMPAVIAENARIEAQRARLMALASQIDSGETLNSAEQRALVQLADEYDVDLEENSQKDALQLLKRRVDTIPEAMILVQAANESGWGSSRFATEGLNFFGQWCFRKGCGLVPSGRDEDGRHEVAKFESVNASVRSYLRNINTHPAYFELRQIREQHRRNGERATSTDLTQGLISYSERREEYIEELNAMIRVNRSLIREVSAITLD